MALVALDLMVPRRGSSATERKGILTEVNRRKYTKVYQVICDNLADDPNYILRHPSTPKIGQSYTLGNGTDLYATCVSVDIESTDHPLVFHLTAQYDTARLVDATFDNPLLAPAELTWTFAEYQRPMVRDILGVPVVNSSGEPFDPPYEVEDSRPTVTIARNEATFQPGLAQAYKDACNEDIFAGALPYYARLMNITGQRIADLGTVYWRVTYEIQFRRESFAVPILDQGFRGYVVRNGNPRLELFRDILDNAPLSNPTLLNGRGYPRTYATGTLTAEMDANTTLLNTLADPLRWPPLASGTPPPPHSSFEVRVDQEVMQVRAVVGGSWVVTRGYAGTTPAAHGASAEMTLEPYYLRFAPFKVLPFRALNLPVI